MDKSDDISFREYVKTLIEEAEKRNADRFSAQEKAVAAALAAAEKAVAAALSAADRAVAKAEASTERRFENSNEWRNTVETLQRTYMPRTESEQHWKTTDEKLVILNERLNAIDQRGRGRGDVWAYIVAAIGVIGAVIGIFLAFTRRL
jgi:hypothetical protein